MTLRVWLVGCALAWAGLAHAQGAASSAPAASSGSRAGLLFEATRGTTHVALFGTVHVMPKVPAPLDDVVRARLARAEVIAVEADPRDPAQMAPLLARYAQPRDGASTLGGLDAAARARVDAAFARAGLPAQFTASYRPWMLSVVLTMAEAARAGYASDTPIDVLVMQEAERLGRPIAELEGAQAQFAAIASVPDDLAARDLLETVESVERGEAIAELREIVGAWSAGDADALARKRDAMRSSPHASERREYTVLLERRDPALAQAIETLAQSHANVFVAIGALHLVGRDCVIDELRKHGFTIERR